MNRLHKISRAFSRANESYDQHAHVQSFVAHRMISKILNENKTPLGTILEIGCGTGILSSQLVPYSDVYILSDIALPLLQKAREKVETKNVHAVIVDGEHPCFSASFDMIVSNLVMHWFQDPKDALKRLVACLKPGGKLYFSTLGNNSFHEWRTAHLNEEIPCGILDFMSFGQLKEWLPLSGTREVEEEWLTQPHENALQFLQSLKGMGGNVSHPAYKPLPYRTFKKLMNDFDKKPDTSCQILFGMYQKPETMREE